MKDERKPASLPQVDQALSTPSEANREKHINYLDEESAKSNKPGNLNDRQKQWQEGIEEGRRNDQQSGDIY